ncbi:MAG: hypothetical protein INR66_01960 [Gordonia polyisoprenivorans]|nr:hypothetical protein [Gordonia polyisoprenivorans]
MTASGVRSAVGSFTDGPPAAPTTVGGGRSLRRPGLVLAGATSALPLMTFTVTGFSIVCLLVGVCVVRGWTRREFAIPVLFCAAGSAAYLVSTLVNETSLTAINVPAFPAIALYLAGIAVLTRGIDDLVALLAGAAVGTVVFYLAFGTTLTVQAGYADVWKYGLAPSITALVLIVVARGGCGHQRWGCVALVGLAGVSIALNFRSHALICLAAAILVTVDGLRRRPLPLPAKAAFCLVLGMGSSVALTAAARSGLLGTALTEKVDMQAAQQVPAILAGRTEPPLSLTAIAHRPILGWGDANTLPATVFDDAYQLAFRWGFDLSYPLPSLWRSADGVVSLHSILLGSWAEAGIVAAAVSVWLIVCAVTLVSRAHRVTAYAPLLMFLGLQALWDLLFSPWSYNLPLVFALVVAFAVRLRALT